MNKKIQAKASESKAAYAKTRVRRWPIYVLMLVFAAVLVSGIFLAGRQHFASMDYGMKNSRLRKQIGELEAEKRRLMLAREVSLSPSEIKRVAKKAGLADSTEITTEVAQVTPAASGKPIPTSAAAPKPMVVKTAAVTPAVSVPRASTAVFTKPEKAEKQPKKTTPAE